MATPLLQKARQRKIIYFAAIAVLFTLSLIHREFVLKPRAYALQLRETARGEAELTSSAACLMLTGSRAFVVTFLWYEAMDKQKRNEWNELELLVKSITKLQPYFVTPWLYQSWNLSFNVAVECDRPRDKYFYIGRGLELLAQGERRNRGTEDEGAARDPNKIVFPGNPDMRYYMGFFYQLKIGTSDERLTMKSLLELSCIDPLERNPDNFWTTDDRNQKKVKAEEFAQFTQKYPRLVRRLHEQLGFSVPERIVEFLQDNANIPNRFKPGGVKQSDLKDPMEQFPLLPPREDPDWPDRSTYELTRESIDVFLVCRTWFQYAQKPLPPENPMPGVREVPYNPMEKRVPAKMVIQLFRNYPPRAQVYIAETLASEGFFNAEGWTVDEEWFQPPPTYADADGYFVVGKDAKYHAAAAWKTGYDMYKDYGIKNGMYFTAAQEEALTREAEFARTELHLRPFDQPPPRFDIRQEKIGPSLEAHLRLRSNAFYRHLANIDAFINQSEGEKDAITVSMRKLLFDADRRRRRSFADPLVPIMYDEAWSLYLQSCLKYPKFAQVTSLQEELYEVYQRYLGDVQQLNKSTFSNVAVWDAHRSLGPVASWPEAIALYYAVEKVASDPSQLLRVVPISNRLGDLDRIRYYDGPAAREIRERLFAWTQGAQVAMSPNFVAAVTYPGQERFLLTQAVPREIALPPFWSMLITDETHRIVDNRLYNR
jgi:hypothetical protein